MSFHIWTIFFSCIISQCKLPTTLVFTAPQNYLIENMSTVQESIVHVTNSQYKNNIDNLIKMALPILDPDVHMLRWLCPKQNKKKQQRCSQVWGCVKVVRQVLSRIEWTREGKGVALRCASWMEQNARASRVCTKSEMNWGWNLLLCYSEIN